MNPVAGPVGRSVAMDVAPGVHRLRTADVNAYVVEGEGGLTLVDAGIRATWGRLQRLLQVLDRPLSDVGAVVLTHGHFDHVGIARRLQDEVAAQVYVHTDDARLAARPFRYRSERSPLSYPLRHPRGLPNLLSMAAGGAFAVPGARGVVLLRDRQQLDVPGRPVVIHTPGHTDGHCALSLPDRDVVLTGDALVTHDPYTGEHGPRIVCRAATASVDRARGSLRAIAATGAGLVLPGHGDPWTRGAESAAEIAERRPVA